jgi:hypothetical protein
MKYAKGLGLSLAVSLLASTALAEIKVGFIGRCRQTRVFQRFGAQKWPSKN